MTFRKIFEPLLSSERAKQILFGVFLFILSFSVISLLFSFSVFGIYISLFVSSLIFLSSLFSRRGFFPLFFAVFFSFCVFSISYALWQGGITLSLSLGQILSVSYPLLLICGIFAFMMSVLSKGDVFSFHKEFSVGEKAGKTESRYHYKKQDGEYKDFGDSESREKVSSDSEKLGFILSNINFLQSEVSKEVEESLRSIETRLKNSNSFLAQKQRELERLSFAITSSLLVGFQSVRDKLRMIRDYYLDLERNISDFSEKVVPVVDNLRSVVIPYLSSAESSPIFVISETGVKKLDESTNGFGDKLNSVIDKLDAFNISGLRDNVNLITRNIRYFRNSLLEFSRIPYDSYAISFKISQMASTVQSGETRRTLFAIEQDIENLSFKAVIQLQKIMDNLQKFEEEIQKSEFSFKEKIDKIGTAKITLWYVKTRYDSVVKRRGKSFVSEVKALTELYKVDEINSIVKELNKSLEELFGYISALKDDMRKFLSFIIPQREKIDLFISLVDRKIKECNELMDEISNLIRELSSRRFEQPITIHDMKSPRAVQVINSLFNYVKESGLFKL